MLEYPLEVSGLKLQYGDDHILGGIALSLEAREIVVVLGVSGSCLLYTSDAADE